MPISPSVHTYSRNPHRIPNRPQRRAGPAGNTKSKGSATTVHERQITPSRVTDANISRLSIRWRRRSSSGCRTRARAGASTSSWNCGLAIAPRNFLICSSTGHAATVPVWPGINSLLIIGERCDVRSRAHFPVAHPQLFPAWRRGCRMAAGTKGCRPALKACHQEHRSSGALFPDTANAMGRHGGGGPFWRCGCAALTYFLVDASWLAMHCHLPDGIFIQVSVKRSVSSSTLPVPSVPVPLKTPIATAVSPNTMSFTSSYSAWVHLVDFASASAAALVVVTLPSLVVCTKFSASSGASRSVLLVCCDCSHFCSNPATAFSVALVSLDCDHALPATSTEPSKHHVTLLFIGSP